MKRTKKANPASWLRRTLAAGPMLRSEVKREASAAGLTWLSATESGMDVLKARVAIGAPETFGYLKGTKPEEAKEEYWWCLPKDANRIVRLESDAARPGHLELTIDWNRKRRGRGISLKRRIQRAEELANTKPTKLERTIANKQRKAQAALLKHGGSHQWLRRHEAMEPLAKRADDWHRDNSITDEQFWALPAWKRKDIKHKGNLVRKKSAQVRAMRKNANQAVMDNAVRELLKDNKRFLKPGHDEAAIDFLRHYFPKRLPYKAGSSFKTQARLALARARNARPK